MLQYIKIHCSNISIFFIRCIILYYSNEYCNISIYCNIVASLQYAVVMIGTIADV